MQHIFIATPCYGGLVTQNYMQSVIGCMAQASDLNLRLTLSMIGNDALVTRARNTLLHQFVSQTDASHILFVDSDISFAADDIQALLLADKPIVGAAYPVKAHYWDETTARFQMHGETAQTSSLRYVGDCAALYEGDTDVLAPVAYLGTGFLLIRRETVMALQKAYPETRYRRMDSDTVAESMQHNDAFALFDCLIDPETKTYLSEDFAFCQRWRWIGGQAWLHRGLRLGHTGSTTFVGNLLLRKAYS